MDTIKIISEQLTKEEKEQLEGLNNEGWIHQEKVERYNSTILKFRRIFAYLFLFGFATAIFFFLLILITGLSKVEFLIELNQFFIIGLQASGSFIGILLVFSVFYSIIKSLYKKSIAKNHTALKRLRKDFKKLVVSKMNFPSNLSLSYSPDSSVPASNWFKSGVFFDGVYISEGEDHFTGKLGETDFEFSEIKAKMKKLDKNNEFYYDTVFEGVVFISDFHKSFSADLFLYPAKTRVIRTLNKKELIKLEVGEFNKHYRVLGSDQVEARYILSTSMLERLIKLKQRFGKHLKISFANNRFNVVYESDKNFFEPRFLKDARLEELVGNVFDDLHLFIGIIEELNLNTRIWSKSTTN